LQLSDGNKTQRRRRVGQSEEYFNSEQQTIFYSPVTESIAAGKIIDASGAHGAENFLAKAARQDSTLIGRTRKN